MKRLLLLGLLCSIAGSSQSISKQVIGNSGSTQTTNQNQITWTLGEAVVGMMTAEDGSIQLANGYHPSLDVQTLGMEVQELNLNVKLYPNPVTQSLFISHPEYQRFKLNLTSMTGKLLYSGVYIKDQAFNMQAYAAGVYLVTISAEDSSLTNTYKIIKK